MDCNDNAVYPPDPYPEIPLKHAEHSAETEKVEQTQLNSAHH